MSDHSATDFIDSYSAVSAMSITVYFIFYIGIVFNYCNCYNRKQKQSPSFRDRMISIVLLLPISGFVLYYLWGREGGKKKQLDEHIQPNLIWTELSDTGWKDSRRIC